MSTQFVFPSCDGEIVPFFAGHKSLRSFYAVTSDRSTMFEKDLDKSVRLPNVSFFFFLDIMRLPVTLSASHKTL